MTKIIVLHLVMFLAVTVYAWIGILGWISLIFPVRYGLELVRYLSDRSPAIIPAIFGCSVYLIVMTGGEIDKEMRKLEGK